jgi:TIR domain
MPPATPAARVTGPYCFFFSYARENAKNDVYFDGFVDDLKKEIADNTGLKVDEVCFLDRESISLGTRWPEELEKGLKASRSFLYLLSPAYLQSPYCVKEWTAFATRVARQAEAGEEAVRMFPVLWVARKWVEDKLPAHLKLLNDTEPGYPAEYGSNGVKWLRRMRGDKDANGANGYDRFIKALSECIAAVERYDPPPDVIPELLSLPDNWVPLEELAGAQAAASGGAAPQAATVGDALRAAADGASAPDPDPAGPAAPAADPGAGAARNGAPDSSAAASGAASPRGVLFAYRAAAAPTEWRPFPGEADVQSLAYALAAGEAADYLPVDPREPCSEVARRAASRNHPLVVLADGTALDAHEAELSGLVAEAAAGRVRGVIVLVLWPAAARGGAASEAALARLQAASATCPEAVVDVVEGVAELSHKLPVLLAATALRLAHADAGAKKVEAEQSFNKPVLVGPGGGSAR